MARAVDRDTPVERAMYGRVGDVRVRAAGAKKVEVHRIPAQDVGLAHPDEAHPRDAANGARAGHKDVSAISCEV